MRFPSLARPEQYILEPCRIPAADGRPQQPRPGDPQKNPHGVRLCFLCFLTLAIAAMLAMLAVTRAAASGAIEGVVPQAASAMGRQIDRQIAERLGQPGMPVVGVSLAVTVPVDVNDLDASNPLARQVAEELARWFVQAGYHVQEIRKGNTLLVEPDNGEMLLTRRDRLLDKNAVASAAVMTGTYSVTSKNVRFNIRVLQTASLDVLGMATASVPLTGEVKSLLGGRGGGGYGGIYAGIAPSVGTMLP